MGNGVLIGFVNISAKLMPNHKFFYSLVTALALDFFPPPDCNFWQRQVFHLDFSFSDLSPAAILYFLSNSCANSRSNKHQLDRQYLQFEKDHLAYGWELCIIEFRRHLRLCYIPPWASTHCYRLRWSRTQYSLKQNMSDISLNSHNINSRWAISQRSLEKTLN